MNGIEKITARIEADARAEAEGILAQAKSECNEIAARYDAEAQEKYWKIVRSGVKDAELRVARLDSTAAMEAKKSILALKQEMVSAAFVRAREMICGLPENQYVSFLAALAARAARTGLEEVFFNERDKESYARRAVKEANDLLKAKGLTGKLTVGEELRAISGGLILKEGDIEVNCSVETLCELQRNGLSTQVAETMFDQA